MTFCNSNFNNKRHKDALMDSITLKNLDKYLTFFHRMYDAVRIVDPVAKCVLSEHGINSQNTDEVCYQYWSDNKICNNCISIRAHIDNKCYMKLEKSDNAIMMVTALPIDNSLKSEVLELLKNATDTMMIGAGTYSDGHLMYDYIKELNEQVVKDKLTGAYNRRYIDERLPADIVKSLVENKPLSVIFIDVDNLKEINDTYGHNYGDKIIMNIADILLKNIRTETDWVARYGGDEFFICLSNTQPHTAKMIAERMRTIIQDFRISQNNDIKTTVSIGVYTMQDNPIEAQELVKLADGRMYEAKLQGKNRVVSE